MKNGMGRSRGLVRGKAGFKGTSRGAGVLREVSGEGLGAAGATMEDGEEQRLRGRMGWGGEEDEMRAPLGCLRAQANVTPPPPPPPCKVEHPAADTLANTRAA